MRSLLLAGCIAITASLAGCAGLSQRDTRVLGGAALGGAAGHVIGGSAAATVGGAAIGGLIGNEVDRRDRQKNRGRR